MVDFVATCVVDGCESTCGADFLCSGCTVELVTLLRELAYSVNGIGERRPGLLEDLDDTVFKQDNVGPKAAGGGRKGHEAPMLIRMDASDLKAEAHNTIGAWVRDFADTFPHLSPIYKTHTEATEWMGGFPGLLAQHPAADEMIDEIRDLAGRIRRMIDQAPDRSYLGPCGSVTEGIECSDDIYGLPNRSTARCRTCGADIKVEDRRKFLLQAVEDERRTVLELSRALPRLLGEAVSVDVLYGRIRRSKGAVVPADRDGRGHALYRVGDVIDLLTKQQHDEDEGAHAA